MDSLQWIDQNSVLLQRRVEEVSKMCDNQRKEQEKTFRLTFDWLETIQTICICFTITYNECESPTFSYYVCLISG